MLKSGCTGLAAPAGSGGQPPRIAYETSVLQVVDTDKYDVVCVSPRNHFVFTPMLPSSAIGTVEFRSLLEPIRISNPFIT